MKFRVVQENNNYTIKDSDNNVIIDGLTKQEIKAFWKINRALKVAAIRNK